MTGAPNPHVQRPQPTRPQRRRAPSPPTPGPQRGRTSPRPTPYATPPSRSQPSAITGKGSAFSSHTFPRSRARNLFSDFAAYLPSLLVSRVPSPRPRSPSPDILLEFYTHTRHPLNLRKHLTILPSWGMKSEEERKGVCHLLWVGGAFTSEVQKLRDYESLLLLYCWCVPKPQHLSHVPLPWGILESGSKEKEKKTQRPF